MLREISETSKEFKKYIYKNALYYYLKIFGSMSYNTNLNDSTIILLVDNSEMIAKSKGEVLAIEGGGFLFRGSVKPMANQMGNVVENE